LCKSGERKKVLFCLETQHFFVQSFLIIGHNFRVKQTCTFSSSQGKLTQAGLTLSQFKKPHLVIRDSNSLNCTFYSPSVLDYTKSLLTRYSLNLQLTRPVRYCFCSRTVSFTSLRVTRPISE